MHLLLLFDSRISLCTYLLQRVGLQSSDSMFITIIMVMVLHKGLLMSLVVGWCILS